MMCVSRVAVPAWVTQGHSAYPTELALADSGTKVFLFKLRSQLAGNVIAIGINLNLKLITPNLFVCVQMIPYGWLL
jgi:hypothetical protein